MDGARGNDVVKSTFMIMIHGDKSEGFTNEGGLATIPKRANELQLEGTQILSNNISFLRRFVSSYPNWPN